MRERFSLEIFLSARVSHVSANFSDERYKKASVEIGLNAGIERVYAVKLGRPEAFSRCDEFTPDMKLMSEAKKATTKYNNLHSSSSTI